MSRTPDDLQDGVGLFLCKSPTPTAVEEKIDRVAHPAVDLGSSHRHTESHGAALWHGNDHVQELPKFRAAFPKAPWWRAR